MNKSEFAATVATKAGISKTAAIAAVEAVLGSITETVAGGGEVALSGFGVFKSTTRPARKGRNPATGEAVNIPAKTSPKFVPGKSFKENVAGNA